jgi:hypothetical protein
MAEVVEVDVEVLVGRAQAGDPDKAEDVTSETFEAVLRRLGGYRPGTDFEAWLFTIAHRRVSDHFRRQGRRRDVVTLREAPAADAAGPEEAALAAEDRTEVARAFSTLREDEQEVLAPRGCSLASPRPRPCRRPGGRRAPGRLPAVAAARALPGDPLWPLRRAGQEVRVSLAGGRLAGARVQIEAADGLLAAARASDTRRPRLALAARARARDGLATLRDLPGPAAAAERDRCGRLIAEADRLLAAPGRGGGGPGPGGGGSGPGSGGGSDSGSGGGSGPGPGSGGPGSANSGSGSGSSSGSGSGGGSVAPAADTALSSTAASDDHGPGGSASGPGGATSGPDSGTSTSGPGGASAGNSGPGSAGSGHGGSGHGDHGGRRGGGPGEDGRAAVQRRRPPLAGLGHRPA